MAVIYSQGMQHLYAWGHTIGLQPNRRIYPEIVQEFEADKLKDMLQITSTVQQMNYLHISCGKVKKNIYF